MNEKKLGWETAEVVRRLQGEGVSSMVLLMRHSARHYSEDPHMEPFMGLTPEGQAASVALGEAMPAELPIRTFSSYIGRCIETAYLVREGAGTASGLHGMEEPLSPFYVNDFPRIIEEILKHDLFSFIRTWCDGGFSTEIIDSARSAAETMTEYAASLLDDGFNGLTLGVTHDWNIFALKEFCLSLPHETWGKVVYLEGVVFYRKAGRLMAICHQGGPVDVALAFERAFEGVEFEG